MGTQLLALGLGGDCPETWNLDKPAAVESVHRSYVEAGSQLILTNTFGATAWKLARSGRAADQERLAHAGVERALRAAADRAWVLGDIGPTGELPEPYGARPLSEFEDAFAALACILAQAGVHGLFIETMSSAEEAAAAVRAARRSCELPVLASLTYAPGKRGLRTLMGETVADATRLVLEAGAHAVGSNCGLGAQQMIDVIREIRAVTDAPILAKPNAGQPRLVGDKTIFEESPDDWAQHVPALAQAGANIVGGCCGTTREHIARARELLSKG